MLTLTKSPAPVFHIAHVGATMATAPDAMRRLTLADFARHFDAKRAKKAPKLADPKRLKAVVAAAYEEVEIVFSHPRYDAARLDLQRRLVCVAARVLAYNRKQGCTLQPGEVEDMRMYLSYTNDFLTVERWAAYHGIPSYNAQTVIDNGRVFLEAHAMAVEAGADPVL